MVSNIKHSLHNYSTSQVISNIHIEREKGQKIGLFLCRTPDQPLPEENGWTWFTMDAEFFVTERTIQKKEEDKISFDRHLLMEFNHPILETVHHLFNKIIVDGSSAKGLHSVWSTLAKLAVPEPETEVVIEWWCVMYSSPEIGEYKEIVYDVENQCYDLPAKDFIKSHKDPIYKEQISQKYDEAIKNHVKNLFEKVELYENTKSPYDELIRWKYKCFWHLSSPIRQIDIDQTYKKTLNSLLD